MKTGKWILNGFSLRNMTIALFLWGFNLFFSFLVYFGFYMVFSISAGSSDIGNGLSKFGVFTLVFELFRNFGGSFSLMISISIMILLIYTLYTVFISAGIFSVMIEEEPVTFYNLFSASVENFFKFLRVFLINLINFFIALTPSVFLAKFFWGILKSSTNETMFKLLLGVFVVIQFFFGIFSIAIYDFSRIIRLRDGRNFIYSFKEGIKFVFRNKIDIIIIYILYAVSVTTIYLVLRLAAGPLEEFLNLIFVFFIFQVFIWTRYMLKIIIIRAEMGIINIPYSEG